uniref:Uncharacterized protein n=1 Tax=Noctiluca scintillans TaxID=2966 RepID=A0A7S1ACS7_NOCSC|mmetsp:Transcript_40570/g.107532  ORF Transcript_40570/g.107532 Transcript_40570/m.107532 type:complete len:137 (+) Transcript_40570:76-486(+)
MSASVAVWDVVFRSLLCGEVHGICTEDAVTVEVLSEGSASAVGELIEENTEDVLLEQYEQRIKSFCDSQPLFIEPEETDLSPSESGQYAKANGHRHEALVYIFHKDTVHDVDMPALPGRRFSRFASQLRRAISGGL